VNRLLNGFNYFWDKKPSNFTKQDVLFLHAWMGLLKSAAKKTLVDSPVVEQDMETMVREIFNAF
jgi:hypothetical protein